MLTRIRQLLTPPVFEGDDDRTRVAGLLNIILLSILAIATAIGIAGPFVLPAPVLGAAVTVPMILLCLGALVLMHRGYVQFASLIAVSVQWVAYAALVLVTGGMTSVMSVGLITATVMAGLLLGGPAALAVAGLSILAGLGIVYIESAGLLPPSFTILNASSAWLALSANLIEAAVILYLAARSLNQALRSARHFAAELQGQRERLEQTVEERTRDLARRAQYLETTTTVARDAASVLNLQDLLSRAVTLISARFNFYHTGLFLLDPSGEWAVLQAASSEGGQRMLARGHQLRLGTGIVGSAIAQRQHRIALDVGADAVFLQNPDLPKTRSELALPLRARGEIIGALDVQSQEPEAFGAEDVVVLQALADQVAVAISNARLFQQAQESLEAERRAYGELRREAWKDLLRAQSDLGSLRNRQGSSPAGDVWRPEMEAAAHTGKTASGGDGSRNLAIPIKVGDHVIGVVDACKPGGTGEGWTEEEVALMETLTDQLEIALESARLYQDTQRRAGRDRLLAEVTARMRERLDLEAVLMIAAGEMRRALSLDDLVIRLATPELEKEAD
jgi:GAF domain-containing protein